jgi:NAD(P)-dependent dehydrogenase (short-subunit alcohol dehydrogenase family)
VNDAESVASLFDLTGKIALVTGAAQGIGRGIAIALAEHGADVVLVDIAAPEKTAVVAQAINQLGRKAWVIQHDLADTHSLAKLASDAWAQAGKLDILVNNAGIAVLKHFHEIDIATWRRIMTVNVEAMFFLSQQVALKMIGAKIKGRIINLSSKNGSVAEAGLSVYNASKGAVELLTQSLATELGVHGITVNALAPGVVMTDIAQDFALDPAFFEFVREHVPLEHRFAQVREIAAGAVFLASPGASYMTGQHLVIDGGVLGQQMPRLPFMPPAKLP